MSLMNAMHEYFRGEKLEAALFILPVGLLFVALAVAAWKAEQGGYRLGVAVPAALLGLVLIAVGGSVAARTDGQVAAIEASYQQDPASLTSVELPRMKQVMVLFSRTVPSFALLAIVGLALRFGVRTDWAAGLGAVLVAAGGAGLLIDGFAERRAERYVAALEGLTRQITPADLDD